MLVNFDKMLKKEPNERPNTVGDNWNRDYDPYKLLNKVNNYKEVKVLIKLCCYLHISR